MVSAQVTPQVEVCADYVEDPNNVLARNQLG